MEDFGALDLDAVTMAPQPRRGFDSGGVRVCDWAQTTHDVTLFLPLALRARQLAVALKPESVRISLRPETARPPLLAAVLFGRCDAAASEWEVLGSELVITLRKAQQREWLAPFQRVEGFAPLEPSAAAQLALYS